MGTIFEMSMGIFGLVLLLAAFIMGNFWGRGQHVLHYQIMNFIGGFVLAWYAFRLHNWIFASLEGIWGAFALAGLIICVQARVKKSKKSAVRIEHV
ncbi:MAG: hypothetical protein V3W00_04860 [Candidatus Brocadiales bacterium]